MKQRKQPMTSSTRNWLTSFLVLAFLLGSLPVSAAEKLEAGTAIMPADGELRELEETAWLLTRPEIEALIVSDAEKQACKEQLVVCQKDLRKTTPQPGYLSTPRGRAFVVGGFAVSISVAFVGGAVFAHSLSK